MTALAVVPLLMLAACSSGGDDGPKKDAKEAQPFKFSTVAEDASNVCKAGREGGSINFRMFPEGAGIDPAVSQANTNAAGAVYGTLMRWNDAEQAFEGDLAESMVPNEDFTEWTLKLRSDVAYPDGNPLDAEAVKQNIERYLDPALASAFTSRVAEIKSMTVKDPATLVFALGSAWGTFPWLLTQNPGMIINPAVLKGSAKDLSATAPANAGAGAYTFGSYERGQSIKLAAKSDWWGGPVCIDDLTLSFSTADSVADYEALKSGQVTAFQTFDSRAVGKAMKDKSLALYELPGALVSPMIFNVTRAPMDDPRLRQAMQLGLDRDLINKRNYDGLSLASGGVVPPNFAFPPTVKALEYDADAAKKLVDEAKADGSKATFSYTVNRTPSNENLAILQQAMLKKVGITLTPDYLQVQDWIEKVFATRNFDVAQGGINVHESCAYCGLDVVSSANSSNAGSFKSAAMDEALAALKAAPLGKETSAALDKVQTVWNDEMPAVMSIWLPQIMASKSDVKGLLFSTSANQVHFDKAYVSK